MVVGDSQVGIGTCVEAGCALKETDKNQVVRGLCVGVVEFAMVGLGLGAAVWDDGDGSGDRVQGGV